VCAVQLERAGGRGAVREFAELLLRARGEWQRALDLYLAARAETPLEATL
jgi:3-deoxy-D-manno-octulosonate 8-phosphate phosphatase KdsC-like HAD superfamily phosphatase